MEVETSKQYCRLCGELKSIESLIDLSKDYDLYYEVRVKLSYIKEDFVCLEETALPRTLCRICYQILNKTHSFLTTVKKVQTLLRRIFTDQSEVKHDEEDEVASPASSPQLVIDLKGEDSLRIEPPNCDSSPLITNHLQLESHSIASTVGNTPSIDKLLPLDDISRQDDSIRTGQGIKEVPTAVKNWTDMNWWCQYCNCVFNTVTTLRIHCKDVHHVCAAYRCMTCSMKINEFGAFVEHICEHTPSLRLHCESCNHIFNDDLKDNLLHKMLHAVENQCQRCMYGFDSLYLLHQHLDTIGNIAAAITQKGDNILQQDVKNAKKNLKQLQTSNTQKAQCGDGVTTGVSKQLTTAVPIKSNGLNNSKPKSKYIVTPLPTVYITNQLEDVNSHTITIQATIDLSLLNTSDPLEPDLQIALSQNKLLNMVSEASFLDVDAVIISKLMESRSNQLSLYIKLPLSRIELAIVDLLATAMLTNGLDEADSMLLRSLLVKTKIVSPLIRLSGVRHIHILTLLDVTVVSANQINTIYKTIHSIPLPDYAGELTTPDPPNLEGKRKEENGILEVYTNGRSNNELPTENQSTSTPIIEVRPVGTNGTLPQNIASAITKLQKIAPAPPEIITIPVSSLTPANQARLQASIPPGSNLTLQYIAVPITSIPPRLREKLRALQATAPSVDGNRTTVDDNSTIVEGHMIIVEEPSAAVEQQGERIKRLQQKEFAEIILRERQARPPPRQSETVDKSWNGYPWTCSLCEGRMFANVRDLRAHCSKRHDTCFAAKCVDCDEHMRSFASFVDHVRLHRTFLEHFCPYCNLKVDKSSLEEHLSLHKLGQCLTCGDIMPDTQALTNHTAKYNLTAEYGKLPEGPAADRTKYRCEKCGVSNFKNFRALSEHVASHKGVEFICDHCHLSFRSRRGIVRHLPKHAGSSIKCIVCPDVFDSNTLLKQHLTTTHQPQTEPVYPTLLPCNICRAKYANKWSLKMHVEKWHSPVKKKCKHCNKRFVSEHCFERHMQMHVFVTKPARRRVRKNSKEKSPEKTPV